MAISTSGKTALKESGRAASYLSDKIGQSDKIREIWRVAHGNGRDFCQKFEFEPEDSCERLVVLQK